LFVIHFQIYSLYSSGITYRVIEYLCHDLSIGFSVCECNKPLLLVDFVWRNPIERTDHLSDRINVTVWLEKRMTSWSVCYSWHLIELNNEMVQVAKELSGH